MRQGFAKLLARASALGIVAGLSSAAFAQGVATPQPTPEELAADQPAAPSDVTNEREIIVTGTQIRGIKPVGSNALSQDRQQIEALGVNNTQQVIAQLPQSNFFLSVPEPGGTNVAQGTSRVPVNRPSLRNIPGFNSGSGQRTLVLIDGHRVVPFGIDQQTVDLAVVPQGILERSEVILDGASAIYGSDAVEGVINLITRKRFDGTRVSGRVGVGEDYWQASAGITQGIAWDNGGITFNYDFTKNSSILNQDRPYTAPIDYINFDPPQLRGANCPIPNVRASGTQGVQYTHRVEGGTLVAGPAYCNSNEYSTFTPAQEMHSGFVTLSQDLGDFLKFELSGLYTHRVSEANTGPFTGTATVRPTSVFYRPAAGIPANANQQVAFSFAPVFGVQSGVSRTTTEIWQVNPELTANVGSGWQVRLGGSYGESRLGVLQQRLATNGINTLANRTAADVANDPNIARLNPYDIAQTSPGVLNSLLRDLDIDSMFTFKQVRLTGDGPLFTLPGGEVRAALGAEWSKTNVTVNKMDENTYTRLAPATGVEENKSVFGEVVVPLFGPENAVPGIHSLTFSASGRYDKYRRVDNFSPKFALTYEPFEWISLRGNWGKSFRAPNAIDDLGAGQQLIRNVPAQFNPTIVAPGYDFSSNSGNTGYRYLYLTGTDADLRPESATSWSIGLDIRPPLGSSTDLRLSASYWNIDFKDTIGFAVIGQDPSVNFIIPTSKSKLCYGPGVAIEPKFGPDCTQADIDNFINLAPDGGGQAAYQAILDNGGTVAGLLDGRTINLGGTKVEGVDVSGSLRQETGFGSIDATINVAIPIKVETTFYPGGPPTDAIEYDPAYTATASVGATIGTFRSQVTVRHRPAYTPNPNTTRLPSQTKIDAFTVADLSLRYDMPARDWFSDGATVTFNVNNLFNARPALSLTANGGVVGGQTLGRVFVLGLTKRFGGDSRN